MGGYTAVMRYHVLLLAVLLLGVSGCRVSGPTTTAIGGDRYAEAFDEVKDVLREQGFELERVDARAGIITTRPQSSSGFFTPWVTSERRLRDEVESSFHRQRRVATVRFLGGEGDRRMEMGPVTVDVDVRVERVYQPGVRAVPASVRLRHVSEDPRGGSGTAELFAVDEGADRSLAAVLNSRIAQRLGLAEKEGGAPGR